MTRRARLGVLAVVAAALAVVAGLAAAGQQSAGTDQLDPSSRSGGASGTLAAYRWFGALGLDVHRVSGAFDLGGTDVLVVVEPTTSMSTDDVTEIQTFLHQGGQLILALDGAGVDAATPLLDALGQGVTATVPGGAAVPLQPLDPGEHIGHVDIVGHALDLSGGLGAPLLDLDGTVVMRGFAVGAGRAYVLGSAYPLSNEGLRVTRPDASGAPQPTGSDAATLVLALLEHSSPPGRPPLRIGFDEVHHGEGVGGGARAIFITPLGLAILLGTLAVVAHLLGAGRRLGRAIPAGDPTRVPTAATYVGAMAGLFARSARRGGVADRYAQELKERVAVSTGADPALDDPAFVAGLAGFGPERCAAVDGTLRRARALAAGRPSEADLLALAQTVDDVERQWAAGARP